MRREFQIAKVDAALGLVFGYAIVCAVDGEPFYDGQGDYIPEDVMLRASAAFMQTDRAAKEMHSGGVAGRVVFAFPLTEDIAASLGIKARKSGLLIAMKPDDPAMLERFANGELCGFSIAGTAYVEHEQKP